MIYPKIDQSPSPDLSGWATRLLYVIIATMAILSLSGCWATAFYIEGCDSHIVQPQSGERLYWNAYRESAGIHSVGESLYTISEDELRARGNESLSVFIYLSGKTGPPDRYLLIDSLSISLESENSWTNVPWKKRDRLFYGWSVYTSINNILVPYRYESPVHLKFVLEIWNNSDSVLIERIPQHICMFIKKYKYSPIWPGK